MTQENESSPLFTPEQIGKELKVTGRTVLNLEARGIITAAVRVGKIVRYDLAQVKQQLSAATLEEVRRKQSARPADGTKG